MKSNMQYEITLDDTKQQAKAALALLKTIEGVTIRKRQTFGKKKTKGEFLQALREGLVEVEQIRAGKVTARPLNELLNGH